jgi:hypothetical protein
VSGIQCQACAGQAADVNLCSVCQRELRDMLTGLAVGQVLPNGTRAPGWLEFLEDSALGRTRLGESARRSTEKGSPMLHNERASDLYNNIHNMLQHWVEVVNLGAETLGQQ